MRSETFQFELEVATLSCPFLLLLYRKPGEKLSRDGWDNSEFRKFMTQVGFRDPNPKQQGYVATVVTFVSQDCPLTQEKQLRKALDKLERFFEK